MAYDPHDKEQVSARVTRKKCRATTAQNDLQWVCSDPRGRRVLARILNTTGLMLPSFIAGDLMATSYREGQRDIGLKLHAVLTSAGNDLPRDVLSEIIPDDD